MRRVLTAILVLLTFPDPAVGAEPNAVPVKLGVEVMLKVLTYDRNFAQHARGDFVVLLAYEPASTQAKNDAVAELQALRGSKLLGHPLRFEPFELRGAALERAAAAQATAVLAMPGLSDGALEKLAELGRAGQLYTLCLEEAQVQKALALGVVTSGGRPQILLNLAAAKQSGTLFEPSVLKLARVVHDTR